MPTTKAKTKKAPAAPIAVEDNSDSEAKASMQNDLKIQLKMLVKSLKASGMDLSDVFETPPTEVTKTFNTEDLTAAISAAVKEAVNQTAAVLGGKNSGIPMSAYGEPQRDASGKLKPGALIPGTQNYVAWSMADLDPEDTVQVSPLPIPSLVWPIVDGYGRQKLRIDKNGLGIWLTVGETQTINKFFYDSYLDAKKQWEELEAFKRNGPIGPHVPWGGPQNFKFTPFAPSFGMNEEGRSLRIGPPTILDYVPGETPEGPGAPAEGESQA